MAQFKNTFDEVTDSVNRAYRTLITGEFSNAKNVANIIVARKQLRALKTVMKSVVEVVDVVISDSKIEKNVQVFNKVLKTIDVKTITKTVNSFANLKISKKQTKKVLDAVNELFIQITDIAKKYKDLSKDTGLQEMLDSINELCTKANESVKNVKGVTNSLNKIITRLAFTSTLAVLAKPVALAGIKSIQLIFKTLEVTLKNIKVAAYKKRMNDIKKMTAELVISMTSLTLGMLAVSMLIVSNIKQMTLGLLGFTVVVGLAVGVLMILSSKKFKKRTDKAARSLVFISASFIGFALTTMILGEATGPALKSLIGFTAVIGVAIGVLFAIALVKKVAKSGALTLALISVAFLGFAGTTVLLSHVSAEMDSTALLVFLGTVVAAATVVWLISKFTGSIVKGVIAMALVGVALILFTVPVMIISNLEPKWENFGYFAAVVGMGVALCVAAGIPGVMTFVLAGAVTLSVVGVSMLTFALVMEKIVGMDIKQDRIDLFKSNIKPMIDAFRDGVKGLGLKDLIKMRSIYGSLSEAMLNIAQSYETIGKIEVDYDTLATGVNKLVTSAINAFFDVSKDPEVGKMLAGNKRDTTVWKVLNLSKDMGKAISNLAKGVRDMAELRVTDYDENGKVIGKRQLTEADFIAAGNGTAKIITALFGALQNTDNGTLKEMLGGRLKNTTAWKAIEVAKEMGSAISGLAIGIKDLSTLTFKDENGKTVKIDIDKGVENTTKLITGTITGLAGLDINNKVPKYIEESGKSIQTFAEATNSLDLSKAKAMQGLLDKLVEFGKGVNYNFRELADIINGKLVEALENLKEVLEETNKQFEDKENVPEPTPAYTPTGNPVPATPVTPTGKTEPPQDSKLSKIEESLRSIEEALQDINTIGIGVKVKNFDDMPSI